MDFFIRKGGARPGASRVLIVEVKADRFRQEVAEDEARLASGEEPYFDMLGEEVLTTHALPVAEK